MGWEVFPDGLDHFLMRMHAETGGLPLYVTENGMANADEVLNGAVRDEVREDFIAGHLAAVKRAIGDGANVKGFFYWSLLDNYEWAEGYEKRFGLVHVDFETLKRVPKSSYHMLAADAGPRLTETAMPLPADRLSLVADVGGTNTRVRAGRRPDRAARHRAPLSRTADFHRRRPAASTR